MQITKSSHKVLYQFERELRWLIDKSLECLYPTRCVCCEQMGALLCRNCAASLSYINQGNACRFCGAPFGRLVCTECTPVYHASRFTFSQARCALEFNEFSRRLILAYKDEGEQRLAPLLARLIAEVIPKEWLLWADVITWVPDDKKAQRRRGFDHMEHMTSFVAEQIGIKSIGFLAKQTVKDQRSLSRAQRQKNTNHVFSLLDEDKSPPSDQLSQAVRCYLQNKKAKPSLVQPSMRPREEGVVLPGGKNIILLDDVFTTGATLSAASGALLKMNAKEIRVATICRVW